MMWGEREREGERERGIEGEREREKKNWEGGKENEEMVVLARVRRAGSPLAMQRRNSLCFDRSSLRRDYQLSKNTKRIG